VRIFLIRSRLMLTRDLEGPVERGTQPCCRHPGSPSRHPHPSSQILLILYVSSILVELTVQLHLQ
jgi:hypothetical protein